MKTFLLLLSLGLFGCASRLEPMPDDNFGVANVAGVRITYPIGGGIDPVKDGIFRDRVGDQKVVVSHLRFYVDGKPYRKLKKGDQIWIRDNTVLLNQKEIFP